MFFQPSTRYIENNQLQIVIYSSDSLENLNLQTSKEIYFLLSFGVE